MSTPDETSHSLVAALSEARIPAENHEFIRDVINAVGIERFHVVDQAGKPYVLATRSDGRRDLRIYYGATNGFASEDETFQIAPHAVGRGPSSRKGTWYVLHPINRARIGGERSHSVRRKATYCDCGMELSLTGVCGSCA